MNSDKSVPTTERVRKFYSHATAWSFRDLADRPDLLKLRVDQGDEFDRWLAAHDAEIRAEALSDASDWARSCSGESADVAADYIDEMAASSVTPAEYKMPGFDGTLEALNGLTIRQTGADR